MATLSGSISRSSHYSSSSVRAESGSGAALAFQPYLDAGCRRLFGNEGTEDHLNLSAFNHCGSSYSVSADVSQFEPGDVVVLAFNCCVVIHAEKVADDGSVSDTFTHRSQLPEDMDPLTVSSTLTAEGILVAWLWLASRIPQKHLMWVEGEEPPEVMWALMSRAGPDFRGLNPVEDQYNKRRREEWGTL